MGGQSGSRNCPAHHLLVWDLNSRVSRLCPSCQMSFQASLVGTKVLRTATWQASDNGPPQDLPPVASRHPSSAPPDASTSVGSYPTFSGQVLDPAPLFPLSSPFQSSPAYAPLFLLSLIYLRVLNGWNSFSSSSSHRATTTARHVSLASMVLSSAFLLDLSQSRPSWVQPCLELEGLVTAPSLHASFPAVGLVKELQTIACRLRYFMLHAATRHSTTLSGDRKSHNYTVRASRWYNPYLCTPPAIVLLARYAAD